MRYSFPYRFMKKPNSFIHIPPPANNRSSEVIKTRSVLNQTRFHVPEQRDHQRPAAWQSTNRSFIIWRYHGTADHQTDWPVRRIDGPSRGNAASGVSWVDCFARPLHKDLCNPIAMLSLASCRGGAFRHASTWGVSATPNLPWRQQEHSHPCP